MKFDIVYTWVDGGEPDYIKVLNKYAQVKRDLNPERYRDGFNMLKYSLRSLETHFNSFNKVYLLTARPQVPEWLDQDHPKLEIVHHDQVIPGEYLPTFNSNVIESFLHRIPGISENFIYLCDDFLFGNDIDLSSFYQDGTYRIFNTFFGENLGWRIYDGYKDIIGLGIIEHQPTLIKKELWEKAYELFPEEVEQTRKSRFRDDRNICPIKLYRHYMLKYQKELSDPVNILELKKSFRFHKITNKLRKQQKFVKGMKEWSPDYYCMNDDLGDQPDPEIVKLIKEFLDNKYPERSTFESH